MSDNLWNEAIAARDEAADLATVAENLGVDELVKEVECLKLELERKTQQLLVLQEEVQRLRIMEHNNFIRGVEGEKLRRRYANEDPIKLTPDVKEGPGWVSPEIGHISPKVGYINPLGQIT